MFGSVGFHSYFKAIQCLPIGDAITLCSVYPVVTVVLAIPLLGERLDAIKIAAIFLSMMGAICIAQPNFLFGDPGVIEESAGDISGCQHIGYMVAALGSFSGGFVLVLIRMVGKDVHTIQLLFSWFFFNSVTSFMVYVVT